MPPKPNKTDEEKKKRAAERKAQRLKEAEDILMRSKRDELAREAMTSQSHLAKNMKEWYARVYAARFPQIKQDMDIAWHSYEHSLDLKEFVICELMDRMDEARIQEAMSWQDYSIKIDTIIQDYQNRVERLGNDYETNLRQLLEHAAETNREQAKTHEYFLDYYKTILYTMEEKFNEAANTVQGEYMTKRDEEEKKGTHSLDALSANLEKSLQVTVYKIKDTLDDYKETTETRRKVLESLRAKDDYYTDMIKRQDVRMARLVEEMGTVNAQIEEKRESRIVLDDLKKDREETYTDYRKVRARLTSDSSLDDNQLLTLTTESNDVISSLERIVEKGEKILRLGDLCRRLETQEEKVLPFGFQGISINPLDEEPFGLFAFFWRRFANVNLIKRKLEPTLEALYEENDILKEQLETTFELMAMINP